MKAKKKDEVFFVKETPDNYNFDYENARFLTKKEADELLAPALKKPARRNKVKKAS